MFKKTVVAAVASAMALVAPAVSMAGGEVQEYTRSQTTTYSSGAGAGMYSNYAPAPMYAQPMGQYYGTPSMMQQCGTMPYGQSNYYGGYAGGSPCGGGGGGLFGNPIFTAGILGLGLGYLIFK